LFAAGAVVTEVDPVSENPFFTFQFIGHIDWYIGRLFLGNVMVFSTVFVCFGLVNSILLLFLTHIRKICNFISLLLFIIIPLLFIIIQSKLEDAVASSSEERDKTSDDVFSQVFGKE